jgi:N-acetylmuramoyl-L-alanine amidase
MYRVVLDPGHGGTDPGAVDLNHNLREKDINLKIALYAQEYLLQNYKVLVKLTRENDVFLSLKQRCRIANNFKADLFVSIHTNSGGGTGFESFIYLLTDEYTNHFQNVLHNEMVSLLKEYGFKDRGMKRENYTVLKSTKMAAVLTENLFIDRDFEHLKSEVFLKQLGQAHAKGIAYFLQLN